MNADRREEIEQALLDAGVPGSVVEYVLRDGFNPWPNRLVLTLMLTTMFGGGVAGPFILMPWLDNLAEQSATLHAAQANALLYDVNVGFSLLIGLFAWMSISGVIGCLAPAVSRGAQNSVFVSSILTARHSAAAAWTIHWTIQHLRGEADPQRYVRRMVVGWAPGLAVAGLVLGAVCVMAISREIQTHSVFTATAYERAAFIPGMSKRREWSSAVAVETGCNHVVQKGRVTDDAIYEIRFHDGAKVRIGDARPLAGDWLAAAETIDGAVRASGATFSLWTVLNRDPMHPACVAALRRRFSETDYERLRQVLRIPADG